MGKKGKSKNKLSKMSEEERARYLQLRADIEEEARRRKQHLLCLYMKNKLKREEAFSRLNLAKINQEWRSLLRQIKCQDLKHEMLEVEKFFRIALERKDRIIHNLLNELDIAEDLYAMLHQSQMEIMLKLIRIQSKRLVFFREQYGKEKEAILNKCKEDFTFFYKNRDKAQEELECVVQTLEEKNAAYFKEKHENHLVQMDEVKSSMTIQIEEITTEREKKLEKIWNEYQEVLSEYVKRTESFYAEYSELKERDDQSNNVIRDQCYEIERATDQIAHLKAVAANATEEADRKINYLTNIRNELSDRLMKMKSEFEDRQKRETNEFKIMSVSSHNCLKFMKDAVQKGETILQLGAVCRRFETEREKVVPYGLTKGHMFEDVPDDLNKPPIELEGATFMIWTSMEKFWCRINNARLDGPLLKREKVRLENENVRLKAQLRDYLVDFNLQMGSNSHVNYQIARRPNSMVLERTSDFEVKKAKNFGPRNVRRPYTCVEANFSNAVRSKMLVAGKSNTAKIAVFRHGFMSRV